MDLPEPRGLVALGMLAWATLSDLRTRRVPNLHWMPFVAAAGAFLAADLASGMALRGLAIPLLLATLVAVLLRALYGMHLFGGADAKGLMVLAFLLPHPRPDALLAYPAALSVLFNASASVVVLPVLLALANVARGDLRLPAMLFGLRMDVAEAHARHVWPLQRVTDDGRLRWSYWQRIGGSQDEAYARLERAGVRRVWVTPKVPFMLPLLVGLAAYLVWGDLLLRLLA